jgi:hypothetical protein
MLIDFPDGARLLCLLSLTFYLTVRSQADLAQRGLHGQEFSAGVDVDSELALLQTHTAHFQRQPPSESKLPKHWGIGHVGWAMEPGCGQCSSYPNIIELRSPKVNSFIFHLAGFDTYMSLASSLCAKIYLRPPCEVLSASTEGNMSREVEWQNYVKGLLGDGTSAFVADTRDCASLKGRHHHHDKNEQNASSNDTDDADRDAQEHCVEYADIHVKNSTFEDQYDAAMKTRELLTPFKWRLDYDWSSIPQAPAMLGLEENLIELFHRRSKTCKDYSLTPSDAIVNATQRLTKALKLKQEGYTTLLLKRRKSHDVCDTSVENVVGYVNCTLTTLASEHRSSPIVFYTDETDTTYLTQLQDALMEACNCSVYHGDAVISAMVPEASDPYNGGAAFAIEIGLIIRRVA